MKLAIADPPYLGRAERWYGEGSTLDHARDGVAPADSHPDAGIWDDPATHTTLVSRLCLDYDGWAIAATHALASTRTYAAAMPAEARLAIWTRPNAMPGGSRITPAYECVWVYIPSSRRGRGTGLQTVDGLVVPFRAHRFAGAKPAAWTRWVLDMLGYDQDTDTVDDLFGGSGAVAREIAQQVIQL